MKNERDNTADVRLERVVSAHVVAWADASSARVSRTKRRDWVAPEPLVQLRDVQEIVSRGDDMEQLVAELRQLVILANAGRLSAENLLAQARVSRDSYKKKYEKCAAWIKEHVNVSANAGLSGHGPKEPK